MGTAAATHINSTLDMQDVSLLWDWRGVGGGGGVISQLSNVWSNQTDNRSQDLKVHANSKCQLLVEQKFWFACVFYGSELVHSQVIWRPWGSCVRFPTLAADNPASRQKLWVLARGNGSCWLLKASPSFAAPLKRTWHPQIYRPPHGRSALSWRLHSASAGHREGGGGEKRKGWARVRGREKRKRNTDLNTVANRN